MKKRYHVWITGRVQRVFFRANAAKEASARGLAGWVRNLPDGRVEAIFEGEVDATEKMLDWCRAGTPPARVDGVEVKEEKVTGEFAAFTLAF
jgi:acylphosphatase